MVQGALISILLGLAFVGILAARWSGEVGQGEQDIRAATAAQQLEQVRQAAQDYLVSGNRYRSFFDPAVTSDSPDNYLEVGAARRLDTATVLAEFPSLQTVNAYGQEYAIIVRRLDNAALGADTAATQLEAVVVTIGGTALADDTRPQVAATAGPQGGYAKTDGELQGSYGGWTADTDNYATGGTPILDRSNPAQQPQLAALLDLTQGAYSWVFGNWTTSCQTGSSVPGWVAGTVGVDPDHRAEDCTNTCGKQLPFRVEPHCNLGSCTVTRTAVCHNDEGEVQPDSACSTLHPEARSVTRSYSCTDTSVPGLPVTVAVSPPSKPAPLWNGTCDILYTTCAWRTGSCTGQSPNYSLTGRSCPTACGAQNWVETYSCTLGPGTRTVDCYDTATGEGLAEAICLNAASPVSASKPETTCTGGNCAGKTDAGGSCKSVTYHWGDWGAPSGCSDVCGGTTTETRQCLNDCNAPVDASLCPGGAASASREASCGSVNGRGFEWRYGDWGGCNVTGNCGNAGTRDRFEGCYRICDAAYITSDPNHWTCAGKPRQITSEACTQPGPPVVSGCGKVHYSHYMFWNNKSNQGECGTNYCVSKGGENGGKWTADDTKPYACEPIEGPSDLDFRSWDKSAGGWDGYSKGWDGHSEQHVWWWEGAPIVPKGRNRSQPRDEDDRFSDGGMDTEIREDDGTWDNEYSGNKGRDSFDVHHGCEASFGPGSQRVGERRELNRGTFGNAGSCGDFRRRRIDYWLDCTKP